MRFSPALIGLVFPLLLAAPCRAQSPRMIVRGQDGSVKLLQLEQADVSVSFISDIAETVLELRYRNDGNSEVEGEFSLPLPERSTVSGYALEVNGQLRNGVAVEKARARLAYETVKRRRIDPGIVERQTGNVYRTQVYPVPAKGTKRLRISYRETLQSGPQGAVNSLPFDFPDPLKAFSCKLSGTAGTIKVIDAVGLEFTGAGSGELKAECIDSKPAGTLKVTIARPDGPEMLVGSDPQPAFLLSDRTPEIAPRPRTTPRTVMLVWDASLSGRSRDHAKEFALLDAWFAKLGKTQVRLRLIRERLEDGGEFDIRNGKWPKLRQALQQIDYDGATALSQLTIAAGDADLVVYVGDGIGTLGDDSPSTAVSLTALVSNSTSASKPFLLAARSSGGSVIDLTRDESSEALLKLTTQPLRLISVQGDNLGETCADHDLTPGQSVHISGHLRHANAGKLTLNYGYGGDITMTREVSYQAGTAPDHLLRQLGAQRTLANLEQQVRPDRARMIAHCKRFGLVSDFTSLIVLERLEDYAEHRIPPPEPELLADYHKLVGMRLERQAADLGGLVSSWSSRLQWLNRNFPGNEAILFPRMRQVGIWKAAIEKQFAPAQLDKEAFETVAGWLGKASELIQAKSGIKTGEGYDTWRGSVAELQTAGGNLADTSLHPLAPGQPLVVSVRGLVIQPGVVTADSGLTLRQAIGKAGGLHPSGSWDQIALYRNARKTVYNTLSERYQDIPLFPGDMVVATQPEASIQPFMDFFASPETSDPKSEGPIREQPDLSIGDSSTLGIGAGGGAADPIASPGLQSTPVAILAGEEVALVPGDLAAFEASLVAGKDPVASYLKLRGMDLHPREFQLSVARILFAHQQPALARRVLSNLVESRPGDVSALRSYAFWLAEFNQSEAAEEVLEGLHQRDPGSLDIALDLASLRPLRGNSAKAAEALSVSLGSPPSGMGELAAVALTEYNALPPQDREHRPEWHRGDFARNPEADLRIVLASTEGEGGLDFKIEEPGGFITSPYSPSQCGGRATAHQGGGEYLIRHAVPGKYRITCKSPQATTLRAVIHTRWGYPDHQAKVVTLWLWPNEHQLIGEVEFEFQPPGN